MRSTALLASGGAALAVSALVAGPAVAATAHRDHAAPSHHRQPVKHRVHHHAAGGAHRPAGAVFVQTDGTNANAVVAYDRAADGTLHKAGTFQTGGKGGQLDGSVVDHLASQGSLALDRGHELLYAVNAGSDSITVFAVRGDRLQRLQTLPSGGRFPVSVTTRGDLVYVLNARDGGSVQGYKRIGGTLRKVDGWNRKLGLDPNATPEFTSTPGEVAFSPDGKQLLITTKGSGSSVDVFGIARDGGPTAKPVVNAMPGQAPFALAFDGSDRVLVTEAGPNAVATFQLHRDGRLTAQQQALTGQMATCWIVGTAGGFFASNAGSGTVSGFKVGQGGALKPLGNTATGAGSVDAATTSDGRLLYVQTGAEGDVVGFHVGRDGALKQIGTVTVPGAVGGEGIVATQ